MSRSSKFLSNLLIEMPRRTRHKKHRSRRHTRSQRRHTRRRHRGGEAPPAASSVASTLGSVIASLTKP